MKKLIAISLTLAILLTAVPLCTLATSESILILGDSNLDLKVNVRDATAIQKYLAKLLDFNDINLLCSDCNDDLRVNIKDATWIQKFAANIDCPYPIGEEILTEKPSESVPQTSVPASEASSTAIGTENTDATEVPPTTLPTESSDPTEVPATDEVTTATCEPTEIITTISTEASTMVTATSSTGDGPGIVLPDDDFTTEPMESEPEAVEYNPVKPDTNITIYFSNNVGWATVNAYFYNEEKQLEMKAWPGTAMTHIETNEYGEKIYAIDVDVSLYNRVVFNNGKSQTLNAAVTVASSGFFITRQTPKNAMQLGVYSYDTADYGSKTTVQFDYPTGYKKPVEIWTPAGYNPKDTTKKYSVIYLLDGQQQFDDADAYEGGWGSDEVITALMKNGGEGIILVGIDNQRNRDNELTPDLGDVIPAYNSGGFKNGSGEQFAEFVAKTVVPYIESNYNVFTDAAHTAVVGSSSGGIEAFYIGMEYMNEFGRIGAISPAFMLYSKATWLEYFKKFDFTDSSKLPRIYFYNGGGDSLEQELLPYARDMEKWLADLGYDQSKMTFVYDEKNGHNEAAWRCIMPEIVTWLFELQ